MMKKLICIIAFIILIYVIFSVNCYAVTETDVQAAVESSSKEAVSGNIFVWFLCAIAFMKVSQKIDSFMSSLGISVGRTGGSMMAEAMIVGRTIGSAFKAGGKFAGFGKGGSSGETSPAGKGGFFGGIGRKMTDSAAGYVTENGKGPEGVISSIGKRIYQNSIGKGGAFATNVISSVARGEINRMGTISGANGKAAMESYFGYNANASVDKKEGKSSKHSVDQSGATTITNNSNVNGTVGFDASGQLIGSNSSPISGESAPIDTSSGGGSSIPIDNVDTIPNFSDIEMGGGRITGIETSGDYPDGIQFAMYDAEKYAKPEGVFDTVIAVDNSKWYKQYAAPTVEKTPYIDTKGKVRYNEKIVQSIPKAPMRKDKM